MLKKIIGTTGTRILNAVLSLIVLLLITNKIGTAGMGIIGLIMLDITIIQLSVDLFAGSSLIYFASRTNLGKLLIPAYFFIGLVVLFYLLLSLAGQEFFPVLFNSVVPRGFINHVLALSLLASLMATHYNLLLGYQRIKTYNIIFTLQITTLLVVFLIQLFLFGDVSVNAYLTALYFAFGLGAVSGFVAVVSKSGPLRLDGWKDIARQVINYGLVTQMANLLSIGNNRLSFFFIKYFSGLSSLGIYTAGIQLTEGLKLIGASIAVVQFSAISNSRDKAYAGSLTIKLMKFSVALTAAAVLFLIVLPGNFYTAIFGNGFSGIKPVIVALSPGVVALAANNIFSHYFSGLGNPKINLFAKATGFIFTVILAIVLIPRFGMVGAAVTTSVSYISTVVHQFIVFRRQTKTPLKAWMVTARDFIDFRILVRDLLKASAKKERL